MSVARPRRRILFWNLRDFAGSRNSLEDVNRIPISNEADERCQSHHQKGNDKGNRLKAAKTTGPESSPDVPSLPILWLFVYRLQQRLKNFRFDGLIRRGQMDQTYQPAYRLDGVLLR